MSTIRTPEPFWKTTGPKAPWGDFGKKADLNFSFDLMPWVSTSGPALTVKSCDVECDPMLHAQGQLAGSEMTVRLRAADGVTLVPGGWLWFRLAMKLSDDQRDDRTFWLRVDDR